MSLSLATLRRWTTASAICLVDPQQSADCRVFYLPDGRAVQWAALRVTPSRGATFGEFGGDCAQPLLSLTSVHRGSVRLRHGKDRSHRWWAPWRRGRADAALGVAVGTVVQKAGSGKIEKRDDEIPSVSASPPLVWQTMHLVVTVPSASLRSAGREGNRAYAIVFGSAAVTPLATEIDIGPAGLVMRVVVVRKSATIDVPDTGSSVRVHVLQVASSATLARSQGWRSPPVVRTASGEHGGEHE